MRASALIMFCAAPVVAQDISLQVPIDCVLDDTCYIQNFVDHDPTDAASDFQCGSLTYDAHNGTDFGLPSNAAMADGVDVLAAAPGIVRGVRNDMRDVIFTPDLEGEINGRDCGNGVVISHTGGWETQYCHMKQGSVSVLPGDRLETGDVLGQVGLSGRTQFPHVHLSVRQGAAIVDPFDPDNTITCGTPSADTLWATPITSPPGGLLAIGFSDTVPAYDDVKAGVAAVEGLARDTPIVLWAFAFGAKPGDIIRISIDGPTGPLFQTDDILDRQQALFMHAGGLNPPDEGWTPGTYTGVVIHERGGLALDRQDTTIQLP